MELLQEFCFDHKKKTVLTFGNFDGVHLGHQKIFSHVIDIAKKDSLNSVIITFDPHPLTFLLKKEDHVILSTEEKISFIRSKFNFNYLYLINFNQKFAEISAELFIDLICTKLKPQYIVSGPNCRFGANGRGNLSILNNYESKYSYKTVVIDYIKDINIEDIKDSSVIYSSTMIRDFLKKGDIAQANKILGRNYSITGIVVSGIGLAKTIGYPTINLKFDKEIIKPRFGVYEGEVDIDGKIYKGIINIGIRPTVTSNGEALLEMHIFNFNSNLISKKVKIFLYNFIRDEKKFNSVDELKSQINNDINSILSKN